MESVVGGAVYISNTGGGRRWNDVSRVALSISCGAYTPANPAHGPAH